MNKKPHVILHHTKKEETQDSSLSPEPKITNLYSHGSTGELMMNIISMKSLGLMTLRIAIGSGTND